MGPIRGGENRREKREGERREGEMGKERGGGRLRHGFGGWTPLGKRI